MTWIQPLALVLVLGVAATPSLASAGDLTLRDVVELHRAGLGDEVLLALIEVDGGPFDVPPFVALDLKADGLSERVIAALVRAGRLVRETNVWAPSAPVETHVVERVVEVPVAVPVAVPIYLARPRHAGAVAASEDLPQPSLGLGLRSDARGAARAIPPRRAVDAAGAIRYAPPGFHPGTLGPRAGASSSGESRGRHSSAARPRGTDVSPVERTPTPGIARSTAGQPPPPGVARSAPTDAGTAQGRSRRPRP